MRPGTKAWLALGVGVAAYEVMCPEGELMSEAVDRALERHPLARAATLGGIAITACHLANAFEALGIKHLDPYHVALLWKSQG